MPQTTLVFIQTTLRLSVAALLQRPGKVPKLRQQGGITPLIYVFAVEGGSGGRWGLVCCGPTGPGIRPDRPPAPSPDVSSRPRACSTRKRPHMHTRTVPWGTRWGHLAQAVRVAPPFQRALLTPTLLPATGVSAAGWFLPFAGKLQTQKAVKRCQDRNKFHRTVKVFAERKFPENSWSFCWVAFPLSSGKNNPPFHSFQWAYAGKKKIFLALPHYAAHRALRISVTSHHASHGAPGCSGQSERTKRPHVQRSIIRLRIF